MPVPKTCTFRVASPCHALPNSWTLVTCFASIPLPPSGAHVHHNASDVTAMHFQRGQ